MTEEIINSDGSRNWQANILLDNVKRLEQENKQMKSALEEIREIAMGIMDDDIDEGSAYYDANQIINKINECIGE